MGCEKLQERIKNDLELGVIVQAKSLDLKLEHIHSAVTAALSSPV